MGMGRSNCKTEWRRRNLKKQRFCSLHAHAVMGVSKISSWREQFQISNIHVAVFRKKVEKRSWADFLNECRFTYFRWEVDILLRCNMSKQCFIFWENDKLLVQTANIHTYKWQKMVFFYFFLYDSVCNTCWMRLCLSIMQ